MTHHQKLSLELETHNRMMHKSSFYDNYLHKEIVYKLCEKKFFFL